MPTTRYTYTSPQAAAIDQLDAELGDLTERHTAGVQTTLADRNLTEQSQRERIARSRVEAEAEITRREARVRELVAAAQARVEAAGTGSQVDPATEAEARGRVRAMLDRGASIATVARVARDTRDLPALAALRAEVAWRAAMPNSRYDLGAANQAIDQAESGLVPPELTAARQGLAEAELAAKRFGYQVSGARAQISSHGASSGPDSPLGVALHRRQAS
jgi:hypothetical protein